MAVALLASSCEDYLDINTNPNAATKADIELVLPQAIVATASLSNSFNSMGGHFGGYIANAGGFSGFGNLLSYNIGPGDYNGLWTATYQDPLRDLKYVIDLTEGNDGYAYYNAAAKIMTAYNYQKLVDAFGNVPYTQALRGEEVILTPVYDDAFEVYQALFASLGDAIDLIENAEFPLTLAASSDPMFGTILAEDGADAQMLQWQKFANTLRLRMLIRLSTKAQTDAALQTFVDSGFADMDNTLGYLTVDALVDPGYELNRPNPKWATWGRPVTGGTNVSNASRIPTTYSFAFFNGVKIGDDHRGEAMFVNFPTTPNNQLGNEVDNPTTVSGFPTWYSNEFNGLVGILKGPAMAQPLMLRAEAMFLIAEAQLNGDVPGLSAAAEPGAATMKQSFYTGIKAHTAYLYTDQNEALAMDTTGMVADYVANNSANRLVNFDLATPGAQQLEAIITQKYIANLMINSDEAFNDFRRTAYPVTVPLGTPSQDIASNKSTSTRPDRLISRVLYPSSEQSFNVKNYVEIDQFVNLIFWDPN